MYRQLQKSDDTLECPNAPMSDDRDSLPAAPVPSKKRRRVRDVRPSSLRTNTLGIRAMDHVEATPLEQWRLKQGIGHRRLAGLIGAAITSVKQWCRGGTLPTIPAAYRIEEATDGEVPVSSWLATKLGRNVYERMDAEARLYVTGKLKPADLFDV